MITDVELKIRPSLLHTVNCLFQKIQFQRTKQGRIDKSIATQLAIKLARKQFSLLGKDTSKNFKLILNYHDAELLERKLREQNEIEYQSLSISYSEWIIVNEYCNKIAQKIA